MPNWALLLLRLALCLLASAIFVWIGHAVFPVAGGWIAFVITIPLYGAALAKPIIEMADEGYGWFSAQPLKAWEGRYYEFNMTQIRVYEDGDKLWFVANDVVSAAGVPPIPVSFRATYRHGFMMIESAKLEGIDVDTVELYLNKNPGHDAARFALWVRREVEKPWKKKREKPG
jgi:hypothetical protein